MWEKLLENGHSLVVGSGRVAAGAVAAGGTPVGSPGMPGTLSAIRGATAAGMLRDEPAAG